MYPILLSFGSIKVYTYGFFIAVGFMAAVLYIIKMLKKSKDNIMTEDEFYTFLLYLLIAAIVGARLLYILINIKDFIAAPLDIVKVWQGGLVYYGGFVLSVIFAVIYTKKKSIPLAKLSDIVAPALPLAHMFGRIGCFFAGCCYGKHCDLPWAVMFNDKNTLALKGVLLHPVQLYEAFGNLVIFILLHKYNYSGKKHAGGKTFAFYLIAYAALRFVLEFFRGDFRGSQLFGMSIAQVLSIFIFVAGIIIIYKVSKNAEKNNI